MPARHSLRRAFRPWVYAAVLTGTAGAASVYVLSPSKKYYSFPAAVPLRVNQDGAPILPKFPSIKTRAQQLSDLKRTKQTQLPASTSQSSSSSSPEIYDLLVIGGGATGTGIALDAVTRGLRVALVERDDFSSGTSSKSTKLVHGGVRYLEKAVWNLDYGQYELVREALRERQTFLEIAPHLSSWLPILLPLRKWYEAPYFWVGAKAYDLLASSEGLQSSYFLTRSKTIDAYPTLNRENLCGSLVYFDGQHNDSRMNIALAMTAAHYGVTVLNHAEVVGLEKDTSGRLCGARIRDLLPSTNGTSSNPKEGDDFIVYAKGIVNATGPYADAINQMDEPEKREIVAPSTGVHVVLPSYFSPPNMGLIDPSSSDNRVVFFLPWQGNIIAGTTDTPCGITKNPVAGEDDINWILNEIRGHLAADINIKRSDVLAAWSGVRPLVRDPEAKNTESLVRSHLISTSASGLLTCCGGKWTTYRQMAEDAVDKAIEVFGLTPSTSINTADISGTGLEGNRLKLDGSCQTRRVRLIGAHGFSDTLYVNLIQHLGLDADVARHLAASYGDRAWEVAALACPLSFSNTKDTQTLNGDRRLSASYPFVEAEVRYAARSEYAQTAEDVLARRTRLSFLDVKAALKALPRVIDIMGEELNWSVARKEAEWTRTVYFLSSMGLPKDMEGITKEEVVSITRKRI